MMRSVIFLFVWLISQSAFADTNPTLKQTSDTKERSQAIFQQSANDKEVTRPGSTPLSTIVTITKLLKERDFEKAGKYLDMRYLPEKVKKTGSAELMRRLTIIWRQQQLLDLSTISDKPQGHLNDGLPEYRDLLGTLKSSHGQIPVYLQKIPDAKNGYIWKISNQTVNKIPLLWDEFGYPEWIDELSAALPQVSFFHMENWQLLGFLAALILSWYLSRIVTTVIHYTWQKVRPDMQPMLHFIQGAFRLTLYILLFQFALLNLSLVLEAKVWMSSGVLDYLAATFFIVGLIELYAQRLLHRLDEKAFSRAMVRPLSTTAKVMAIIVLILSWLNDAGYNLTTVLTGLGIGSLAIALAAQKTLENVFGAFTLYIARPIKPGDFCKFGEYTGTVEEIGLRSTRIRKLDRTVVHVPNSVFSSKELENFAEIDRRHFRRELRLRLDTSPAQIKQLLIALRKLITAHPKFLDTAARVRFENIERDAYLIVINGYIDSASLPTFKAIVEDVNLRILEILEQLQLQLSVPEQRLTLVNTQTETDNNARQLAETEIQQLIDQNLLPFPDLSDDEKETLKQTLDYPPKGSVSTREEIQSIENAPEKEVVETKEEIEDQHQGKS